MAVDSAISSIANSSSSYSATSKGKTSGSDLDKEAFLNLLVTQMQYQDPLNPSDNTEYMSQLAQYSALEAQLNISDTLDKGNNLNLVGKYVIMNTTDSSGKQAMISGLVEYATVKDGDVYLSVNNTYYPAEDLDSVIDYDYYLYLKQHANSDGTINKDNNTGDSTIFRCRFSFHGTGCKSVFPECEAGKNDRTKQRSCQLSGCTKCKSRTGSEIFQACKSAAGKPEY